MSLPKILMFISQAQPNNYELQVAATAGVPVQFRNIRTIKANDPAELADGVAGTLIPGQYAMFPTAVQALTYYRATLNAPVAVAPVVVPTLSPIAEMVTEVELEATEK